MSNLPNITQTSNLVPLDDIKQAAEWVSKSGLFGITSPEQAATLMLVAQAEGSHFMTAMREFHVIKGMPAIKADAALARFQKSGGKVQWLRRDDTCCEATFFHPQGGELTVKWTLEMADKAGFSWDYEKAWDATKGKMAYKIVNGQKVKQQKDNWVRMPRQMLAARVVSEGVRAVFAACINGFYTTEEVQDFDKNIAKEANEAAQEAEKALEAELVAEAPASEPQPDYTVNINGSAASTPANGLTNEETTSLCQWIRHIADQEKAKEVIKKYCPPPKIQTLSKTQAIKLIGELQNIFGITYAPDLFNEEKEAF
jgi:hypothetical protein